MTQKGIKNLDSLKTSGSDCISVMSLKNCVSTLQMLIHIFGKKMFTWFKKFGSAKKLPISNSESFLESIFDLN